MDIQEKNNKTARLTEKKDDGMGGVVENGNASAVSKNIMNHIYVYVSILLIVGLSVCVVLFSPNEKVLLNEDNSYDEVLNAFSEKFGVNKDIINLPDSSSLWYDEYIYANVREKIIVHHYGNIDDTIRYADVYNSQTRKQLKDRNDGNVLAKLEKFSDIKQRVISEYSDDLEKMTNKDDKLLSYFYNAVVGDTIGHFLIAYDNETKYVTRNDIPRYTINKNRLVDVVNRENLDTCKDLYAFLIDEGVLHEEDLVIGYVDYRRNKLFIDDTTSHYRSELGPIYASYYDTICQRPGMVLYNKEIQAWPDLAFGRGLVWCVPDVAMMKSTKVVLSEEPYPIWLLLLGVLCGLAIGLLLYFIRLIVRIKNPEVKDSVPMTDSHDKVSDFLNRNKWKEDYLLSLLDFMKNKFDKIDINTLKEKINDNEINALKYKNLMKISSEKALLKELENIHGKNKDFPEITSLKTLYKKAKDDVANTNASDGKSKIIDYILKEVENVADSKDNLKEHFSDICNKSKRYRDIQVLVANSKDPYATIKEGLTKLDNSPMAMSDFVDFAELFKGDFAVGRSYSNSFAVSKKIIDESNRYISGISRKDTLNYWDRLPLILWSVTKVAVPMMNAWKKELRCAGNISEIENNIKSDFLQLYQSRIFMKYQDEKYGIEDFNSYVNIDLKKILDDFNRNNQEFKFNIDDSADKLSAYKKTMEKLKYGDRFVDNMWNAFVEDFVKNAENNNDKSWFFENIINIAIHASEYVDAIKCDRINYCDNLKMLMSGFNDLKIGNDVREYKHGNPLNSSSYADRVYEWVKELEVRHLKVLVNKYYIMP